MIYPKDHVCHNSNEIFNKHTQDVFDSMGLVILFFGEVLENHKGYVFYSNTEFFQKRCDMNAAFGGTFLTKGVYPWSETLDSELVALAAAYGYYHPINIVINDGAVRSIYTVAFKEPVQAFTSYYLNNLDNLLFNCMDLKLRLSTLIEHGRKQALVVPQRLSRSAEIQVSNVQKHDPILQKEQYITKRLQAQGLSKRECQTFISMLKFQSSIKMSESLNVSPKTIDTYVNRIKQKLSLDNRHDIFKYAWDNQFVGYKNYPNL